MPSFMLRVQKIKGSRARPNPTSPASVRRFLTRFKQAVRASHVELSSAAEEEAWTHFGLSKAATIRALLKITVAHYECDEPGLEDPRQQVWVFCTPLQGPLGPITARIVIRETPGWYVIKFHQDIYDGGDP